MMKPFKELPHLEKLLSCQKCYFTWKNGSLTKILQATKNQKVPSKSRRLAITLLGQESEWKWIPRCHCLVGLKYGVVCVNVISIKKVVFRYF